MEANTYSSRNNARRAGVAAGVANERVEITVHKNGDEVRFGWKAKEGPVLTVEPQQEKRNGVKRPKEGGLCAAVWAWLDAHPYATVKEAKEAAPTYNWNANNVSCEFYAWRKYHGISGRAKAV